MQVAVTQATGFNLNGFDLHAATAQTVDGSGQSVDDNRHGNLGVNVGLNLQVQRRSIGLVQIKRGAAKVLGDDLDSGIKVWLGWLDTLLLDPLSHELTLGVNELFGLFWCHFFDLGW